MGKQRHQRSGEEERIQRGSRTGGEETVNKKE